jgi:uncharacterized metal-binding protein YceD (DUF177 family)
MKELSPLEDESTTVSPSWKKNNKTSSKEVLSKTKKPLKTKKHGPAIIKDASWKIRDSIFKIKIADLLNETWKQDDIVFEHKFSEQLSHLDDQGIAWNFTIQSLDATSLLGTLTDVSARFHETCDSCSASFLRTVDIPLYTGRFVFEDESQKKEVADTEEVIFFIDSKAETINIEDMVVQAILLDDPFVKRCAACTKRLANLDDDEDDLEEFQSKWNVVFS